MEYFKVVDSERAREKQLEEEFKKKREVNNNILVKVIWHISK